MKAMTVICSNRHHSLQLEESLETEEFFSDGLHDSKQMTTRSVLFTNHPFGNLKEQFSVQTDKLNSICSSYDHLKDINFPDIDNNQVSVFIVTDNIYLVTSQATFKNQKKHKVQFPHHLFEISFPSLLF